MPDGHTRIADAALLPGLRDALERDDRQMRAAVEKRDVQIKPRAWPTTDERMRLRTR